MAAEVSHHQVGDLSPAASSQPSATPRCDLVLLSWNRADLLVPCVERIFRYTTIPSRLLIVDNASTDAETLAYLDRVKRTTWVDVRVVRRPHNDGFAVGMNEGLAQTSAPWICLLNNDILVTEGWLSEMLYVAETSPMIGLLNPMSNEFHVGPTQPGETIDDVARSRRDYHGQWLESCVGVGFCLLLSRRVLDQVGYLDAYFKFMYFEDRDYSSRMRQAGLVCAIAEGAYVYHHISGSARDHPNRTQWFQDNEERFYRKWQTERSCRIACVLSVHAQERPEATRARIRDLANGGHRVWVFGTSRRLGCVPRHLAVTPRPLSRFLYPIQVLWGLLTKKKRFHRMIVAQGWLRRVLHVLQPFHRAHVIVQDV